MKRSVFCFFVTALLCVCFPMRAGAERADMFYDETSALVDSISDDVKANMEQLGYSGTDISQAGDISVSDILAMIGGMIASAAVGPLATCALLTAVIVLSSLLESYTFSLRYVDTKDVMNAVSSLMIITALVTPLTGLIQSSLDTVKNAASLMLLYVPVMVGMIAFGGHIVSSGGYYATVMTASQGLAQLSSAFFAPILNIYLALSVSSAVSERIRLNGICELIGKLMKWMLTFSMTVFTAILSVQGFASNAVDTVASRTVRFTLSSFIPVVGASVSEAYKTIEGSVNLLRSGVGVFVIIAVAVAFLPHIISVILWQISVNAAKTVAETFGVSSIVTVLTSISAVLSVLMAVVISLCAVFLISTGVLTAIGSAS